MIFNGTFRLVLKMLAKILKVSALTRNLRLFNQNSCKRLMSSDNGKQNDVYSTNHLFNETHGAIAENPARVRFGNLKISIMLFLSILVGAGLSKKGTKLLEQNQLYIFEDDEDLDDDDL